MRTRNVKKKDVVVRVGGWRVPRFCYDLQQGCVLSTNRYYWWLIRVYALLGCETYWVTVSYSYSAAVGDSEWEEEA